MLVFPLAPSGLILLDRHLYILRKVPDIKMKTIVYVQVEFHCFITNNFQNIGLWIRFNKFEACGANPDMSNEYSLVGDLGSTEAIYPNRNGEIITIS
mmetsp:Transcript_6842/g.10206  ORF Transcript_6842/g.10206 Transcript_6842/m.10206 type:complete len:97 (-) Transcript_6842:8-298(-)